jgi:hypothetical protein
MLSAASDYFAAMFTSSLREATQEEIEMHDVDPDALWELVRYCYTGSSMISSFSRFICALNKAHDINIISTHSLIDPSSLKNPFLLFSNLCSEFAFQRTAYCTYIRNTKIDCASFFGSSTGIYISTLCTVSLGRNFLMMDGLSESLGQILYGVFVDYTVSSNIYWCM